MKVFRASWRRSKGDADHFEFAAEARYGFFDAPPQEILNGREAAAASLSAQAPENRYHHLV
ncbi:hypothetical protein [Rhizobium leguminosarum]|uniref:hypothetical protein n=1 Tax=Rhizobium leguminosarum TaxID=384 RepID=UPI0014421FFE|nr:hypothetical protein [Rhizobium leguminosarum]NKK94226.1 hypothetical protein [Rhizobium leguminosarum bv. viciae]